jgi:acetoin utilization deacetylase AcuC-like enzyme
VDSFFERPLYLECGIASGAGACGAQAYNPGSRCPWRLLPNPSNPLVRTPLKAFYSDHFVLPLPENHRFPMQKYAQLRQRVLAALPEVELAVPTAASDGQLALAHEPDYVHRVAGGTLDAAEVRAIGFPWSAGMVERSRRSVGATIAACRAALTGGVAANLAGGTHHAARARGAGYCVFNDAAVAARVMQADSAGSRRQLRVAVIDLDVHQGDGTAQILAGDDSVFTLSMHGETNFPFRKQASDLDIALPDGTQDEEYLAHLDRALAEVAGRFDPQLVIYLAGADAHEYDRLGKLALTADGMRTRDERVFGFAERIGAPLAVTMAGGYGRDIDVTVELHLQTVRLAYASWRRRQLRVADADARA